MKIERYTVGALACSSQECPWQGSVKADFDSPGGFGEVAPPVPIPNTAVKRLSADDTALVTGWENRSPPGGILVQPPRESSAQ